MSTTTLPLPTNKRVKDLTGMVFGRLTVTEYAGSNSRRNSKWNCVCTCGVSLETLSVSLLRGVTKSCGCLSPDRNRERASHGMSNSAEFRVWADMWQRCTNPNNKAYPRYKDRAPPDIWRDFAVFYAELGPRPTSKHTLERVDNDKPYGPGNCRWATVAEQNRNTSKNVQVLTADGQRLCLSDACAKVGLLSDTVRWRRRRGMTIEQASNGLLHPAA